MRGLRQIFISGWLLLLIGPVCAEIYRWVDKDGNVHFGDQPPESAKVEKLNPEINSITMPLVEPNAFLEAREKMAKEGSRPSVVMYSAEWCGVCKEAARYFRQNNIPFREYDVEKSEKGKRDYKRMNGRGVPIILVGDQRMSGFSSSRFQQLYDATNRR